METPFFKMEEITASISECLSEIDKILAELEELKAEDAKRKAEKVNRFSRLTCKETLVNEFVYSILVVLNTTFQTFGSAL